MLNLNCLRLEEAVYIFIIPNPIKTQMYTIFYLFCSVLDSKYDSPLIIIINSNKSCYTSCTFKILIMLAYYEPFTNYCLLYNRNLLQFIKLYFLFLMIVLLWKYDSSNKPLTTFYGFNLSLLIYVKNSFKCLCRLNKYYIKLPVLSVLYQNITGLTLVIVILK